MSATNIESIFHPSDFSAASEVAFIHALKIALVTHAMLHMLHVDSDDDADWSNFPGVRATLERWQLIPSGSPKSAVIELGIDVSKIIASSSKPVRACLDFLARHPADLIVLAVRQQEGRMRWLESRVGGPMAREAAEMTLFLPEGVQGFVSAADGTVSLHHILIPVDLNPSAEPAIAAVLRIIDSLELASGTVTMLHVGRPQEAPALWIPENREWLWRRLAKEGEAAEVIVQTAEALQADLIVMTTSGPQGFLDALRGSTSERVLRRSPCPVLSLPAAAVRQ